MSCQDFTTVDGEEVWGRGLGHASLRGNIFHLINPKLQQQGPQAYTEIVLWLYRDSAVAYTVAYTASVVGNIFMIRWMDRTVQLR